MTTAVAAPASHSTELSILTESEKKQMSSLSRIVSAYRSHLANPQLDELERALVQSKAIAAIEQLLTPEILQQFMRLMDSPYGFKTDRGAGSANKGTPPYGPDTVRRCLIQAWLSGAKVTGNQFNIIAGNCYLTKEFNRIQILETEGVSNLRLTVGPPQRFGERTAVCEAMAEWTYFGKPQSLKFLKTAELDARIVVNAYSTSGPDEIRGRVESKLYQRVLNVLTGLNHESEDVIEAEAIVISTVSDREQSDPGKFVESEVEESQGTISDSDAAKEVFSFFVESLLKANSVNEVKAMLTERRKLVESHPWPDDLKFSTIDSMIETAEERIANIRASRGQVTNHFSV